MTINKFSLQNFRSFIDNQTVTLGVPDGKNSGSGITYIVGENNVGKTSLLEAIKVSDTSNGYGAIYLNSSDVRGDLEFSLLGKEGLEVRKVELIHKDSFAVEDTKHTVNYVQYFTLIPSRRHWSPQVMNNTTSYDDAYNNTNLNTRARSSIDEGYTIQVADMLQGLEGSRDRSLYNESVSLVRKVFRNLISTTLIIMMVGFR